LVEVDPVELDAVNVNVQSHGRINALHHGDGVRERVTRARQTERLLCSALSASG
jgi:hypothetical protein